MVYLICASFCNRKEIFKFSGLELTFIYDDILTVEAFLQISFNILKMFSFTFNYSSNALHLHQRFIQTYETFSLR